MAHLNLRTEDIMTSYEQTRIQNKRIEFERQEQIYKEIPEIKELCYKSVSSYLDALRLRIDGGQNAVANSYGVSESNRQNTEKKKALLVKAGYPADYLDPVYTCKKCHDTGYIGQERCSCYKDKFIHMLYKQSNLEAILEKENFSTFTLEYYSKEKSGDAPSPYNNASNILDKIKSYVENFGRKDRKCSNLLIYGDTGLGKTFLTHCIAKQLLDEGYKVFYLSSNQLFEDILGAYIMRNKKELEDLYNHVFECDLLIIDDLGTEYTNGFVCSQLFELINDRKQNQLATIFSTNLEMPDLRDTYSERVMSRFIADYTVFNIYGDNIRYQIRKKAINTNA